MAAGSYESATIPLGGNGALTASICSCTVSVDGIAGVEEVAVADAEPVFGANF